MISIDKLKKLADLKEEYERIQGLILTTQIEKHRINATSLLEKAFEEFEAFFVEKGFTIANKEKNDTVDAIYKSEKITLYRDKMRTEEVLIIMANDSRIGEIEIRGVWTSSGINIYTVTGNDETEQNINELEHRLDAARKELEELKTLSYCYFVEHTECSSFTRVIDLLFK